MSDTRIVQVDCFRIALPLTQPFVVAYASAAMVESVVVRVQTAAGIAGWGEATPDPNVTGETQAGVFAAVAHLLAPAIIGRDIRDRESTARHLRSLIDPAPAARAALDIAVHDALGRTWSVPLWGLLGGRSHPRLTISRVVSLDEPDVMASAAAQHVERGFRTVKVKVGDAGDPWRDVARIAAVRAAIGAEIGLKIDVNQGWRDAATAIRLTRAVAPFEPLYIEQPVAWWDIAGLSEVRRQTGVPIMADEACHGPREMLRIIEERAADLVNIKVMKAGSLPEAWTILSMAETANIPAQVGTMVESSIASAAGLHLAVAHPNVRSVEMGGPLMLARDIGDARAWYDRDTITVPDQPGLGITVDADALAEATIEQVSVTAPTI